MLLLDTITQGGLVATMRNGVRWAKVPGPNRKRGDPSPTYEAPTHHI
jgi:hypothetical protein